MQYLILILLSILPINQPIQVQAPCWCQGLIEKYDFSRNSLLSRYGEQSLDQASSLFSSGTTYSLAERLFQSLHQRIPFSIGVLGGSFTLPTDMK